jgi:ribosomal protein S18 acetylase RimI-like enzyme
MKTEKDKSINEDVVIRRGTPADVDNLVELCRIGFPHSIKWNGLRVLPRKWWKYIVMLPRAETWVVQNENKIVAACVLITNETQCLQEKRQFKRNRALLFLSAILNPILVLYKIIEILRRVFNTNQSCELASINFTAETRAWIEIIVVSAEQRGCGFAKRLLQHCEDRTKSLGRKAIGLHVKRDNQPARCLYESLGYLRIASTIDGYNYAKVLI